MKRATALLALAAVLGGCGGSGSGSSILPVSNSTRQVQVGDKIVFSLSGDFTPSGGVTKTGTGTETLEVTSRVGPDLTYSDKVHFANNDGTVVDTSNEAVIEEATDGSMKMDQYMEDGMTMMVKNTTFHYPGTWQAGWSLDGVTDYMDGSSDQISMKIIGKTVVSTNVGNIEAWECTYKVTQNGTVTSDMKEYWVPKLANRIKSEGTIDMPGGSLKGIEILDSTSVSLR